MSQASTGGAAGKETTMGYGRYVGRAGALAVATRMTVSIGVAVLVVVATVAPASAVSPAVRLSASNATVYAHRLTCRLDPGRDHRPDARRRLRRRRQEPLHRADSSGPGHRVRHGDDAHGGLARHGGRSPRLARGRAPEHLGAWWPGVAGRAVVETLGALRPHLRSVGAGRGRRSGGRRWPSTPTTIW